jgi:hypothetical protein
MKAQITNRTHIALRLALTTFVFGLAVFTPLVSRAAEPPSATEATADALAGSTNCNFLPAGLCPADGDINSVIAGTVNLLVGIFSAVFVLMVVIAGVQMASAGDSPDRLKAAKGRLTNAIVGLVFLVLMRAILALLGIVV